MAPKEVNPNQKKANVIAMNWWNTRNRFEQCSSRESEQVREELRKREEVRKEVQQRE